MVTMEQYLEQALNEGKKFNIYNKDGEVRFGPFKSEKDADDKLLELIKKSKSKDETKGMYIA